MTNIYELSSKTVLNPTLQLHLNPPAVFWQLALESHGLLRHSLSSLHSTPSPEKPSFQYVTKMIYYISYNNGLKWTGNGLEIDRNWNGREIFVTFSLHSQVKPPCVLVHFAFSEQLSIPARHS